MKKVVPVLLLFVFGTLISLCLADSPTPSVQDKGPAPDSKVLVIFVDGLRPDTVDSMVARGALPNIKRFFYDKGLRFPNFFSTFPSLTIPVTTCLITGKRQDQSGLKAQSHFERFPLHKKSALKRMFTGKDHYPRFFNMLSKVELPPRILKQNKIKALYNYIGEQYHTALFPVSPTVLPWAWPHIAANEVERPYFVAADAPEILDDLNGKYGLRYMIPDTRGRLFMIWFAQLDEDQHHFEGGQSAPEVQKRLETVDQWMGRIYDAFVREDNGKAPYVVLFSDHGAYGGKNNVYNQPYYLGRDFFYKQLKINVRGPDHSVHLTGSDLESYAYIDNMGRGESRIFLPVGDILSGNWERPNTLYELEHYGLGPNRKSIDLIQELLSINLEARNKFPGKIDPHPVDLLFVKISENLIYVIHQGGARALIEVEHEGKNLRTRYRPVENVVQEENGKLTYTETLAQDPFGYLKDPKFHAPDPVKFIQEFHTDQEWLDATYETAYPDAITALTRSLVWSPELVHLAKSQDPDVWLSAAPGWNFRFEDINGADHGAILRDSMHATLMFSGTNIRTGVDPSPHRIIDVTPTLLQLIGYKGKADLDSVPIEGIYEAS